jgi:Domain of unknown function (DUF543)
MAGKEFAEDKMGNAIDRCFSDAVIKAGKRKIHQSSIILVTSFSLWKFNFSKKYFPLSGVGLTLGGVFSLFFFKRRMWPLYGGTFFGLGVAYNNCEKALNSN